MVAQGRTGCAFDYSVEARRRIRMMIAEFRPNVAHVRNIYHPPISLDFVELEAQRVPVFIT